MALVGYLAWLLWPHAPPHTYLAALPIIAQDKLTVPPLAFAQEDALGLHEVASDKFVDLKELQEADALDSLSTRLASLSSQPQDVTIVYVAAYGVSEDGEAYVLASDLLRRAGAGRYKVSDLLRQLKDSPGTKMLVLDCGRLGSDARLGMLANEFPKSVEKQVRELKVKNDADLWVLLSNSSLQVTSIAGSARKSIFGQSMNEALLGQADVPNTDVPEEGGNNDLKVSLKEFGNYLINRVADWYSSDRSAAPTPLFLRGGTGLVPLQELPDEIVLVRLPADWNKPPAEKKGDGKTDGKSDGKTEEKVTSLPLKRSGMLTSIGLAQAPAETPAKTPEAPAGELPAKKTEAADKALPAADAKTPDSKEAKEDKKEERKPAKKTEPTKQPAAEKPSDSPPPADGEKISQQHRSQLELRNALDQAWQLRDKLQSRSGPGGWSPIDFAPHLWRELNALLLDYEQRCRAGEAFSAVDLTRELDRLLIDLKQLDSQLNGGEAQPVRGDDASVGTRLADAWNRFSSQTELLKSFTEAPLELEEVKQAMRFQADNAFAATYYVRWHERASFSSVERLAQFDDLSQFLKLLETHGSALQALEGKPFDPARAPYLRDDRKEIEAVRKRIDQRLEQDGEAALKDIDQPVSERKFEDLLSTPLLSAVRRKQLLGKLLEPGRKLPPRKLFDAAKRQGGLSASLARWDRLLDRLELERKLIRLFDPKLAGEIDSQFDSIKLTARNSKAEDELWTQYRQIGKRLKAYLAGLPKSIEDLARDSGNETSTRRAELLLSLVDARDARSLPTDLEWRPRLRVLPPTKAPRLAMQALEEMPLDIKEWRSLKITVEASGQESEVISIVAKFETEHLELRVAGGASIASGDRQLVKLGSDNRATLDWEIRAKTDRVDSTKLLIHAQAEDLMNDHSVHCGLPKPNEIDLIATRVGRPQPEPVSGQDGVQLRAFPNRETAFRLLLSNRSGKAKKVKVELLVVPPQPGAKWAPGRLFAFEGGLQPGIRRSLFDGADKLLPNAKVLATAKSLALLADPGPIEIDFPPPAPPAAAPKPAAPDAAAGAPPPMSAAPSKTDVTQGLLCLLTNLDNPAERWLKWIELNPLQPKDYLDAEIGYDLMKERIFVNLRPKLLPGESQPKPEEVLPIGLAEKPIAIVWDTTGELPDGSERNDHALFDGGKPSASLYAAVPPDVKERKQRIVRLTVDGYPRAFVYAVDCTMAKLGEDLKPARQHVRINSVESPDFLKTFYFSSAVMPKDPPPPAPGAKKPVLLEAGEAATIPAPCKVLKVQFEVDVPKDAFQLSDRDDLVEVGLDVEGADRKRFYADRQMTTRLVAVGPQGLLTLDTEVRDYSIELDPGGLQNKRFQLTAQLVLAGSHVQGARVPVVLDGLPPDIKSFNTTSDASQKIVPGEKFVARLNVADLSGIAQVEFGFDLNQSGDLEKDEAKILPGLAQPPADDTWSLELSTKDLPPGPNFLMARATDRVGFQSRPRPLRLVVPSPDAVKGKMDKGTIKGVVMFGKLPADNIKVTLSFPGAGVQRTKNGGKFQFDNVPAGEYTLQAGGSVQNVVRQGKLEKIHPSPPDKPDDVILMLE
ncbi:MAG: hypothetical protein K8R36_13675 [Planctomycetales bacterium]|nr:hypothetical protein [Planctomycetales bacterium]